MRTSFLLTQIHSVLKDIPSRPAFRCK